MPLSTLEQWVKEFKRWAPQLYVIGYIGDAESRKVIRQFDFYWEPGQKGGQKKKRQKRYRFNILLTTYELVLKDALELRRVNWCFLAVDEAQHLKNGDTKLYSALSEFDCNNFRMLITGAHAPARGLGAQRSLNTPPSPALGGRGAEGGFHE